jgi:hypothetical protein
MTINKQKISEPIIMGEILYFPTDTQHLNASEAGYPRRTAIRQS